MDPVHVPHVEFLAYHDIVIVNLPFYVFERTSVKSK